MNKQIDSGVNPDGTFKPQTTRTRYNGTLEERYGCYLACADDGNGNDFTTGLPLKSFEDWLGS